VGVQVSCWAYGRLDRFSCRNGLLLEWLHLCCGRRAQLLPVMQGAAFGGKRVLTWYGL
jgi:hypothetical protein